MTVSVNKKASTSDHKIEVGVHQSGMDIVVSSGSLIMSGNVYSIPSDYVYTADTVDVDRLCRGWLIMSGKVAELFVDEIDEDGTDSPLDVKKVTGAEFIYELFRAKIPADTVDLSTAEITVKHIGD